jgi:hypothetical protein
MPVIRRGTATWKTDMATVTIRPERLNGIKDAFEIALCVSIDLQDIDPKPGDLPQFRGRQ